MSAQRPSDISRNKASFNHANEHAAINKLSEVKEHEDEFDNLNENDYDNDEIIYEDDNENENNEYRDSKN